VIVQLRRRCPGERVPAAAKAGNRAIAGGIDEKIDLKN
jgi:hypothetical protein